MPTLATPQQEHSQRLKHALAIAIVAQKRQKQQEAAAWKAKAQQLETELKQQQQATKDLQAWAKTLLSTSSLPSRQADDRQRLPTLSAARGTHASHDGSGLTLPQLEHQNMSVPEGLDHTQVVHFTELQQQLEHISSHQLTDSAKAVLSGKASSLSHMLITNIRVLKHLHQDGPALQVESTTTTSLVCDFILSALIHIPQSSLCQAYMQQAAAVLAACLNQQPSQHAAGEPSNSIIPTTPPQLLQSTHVAVLDLISQLLSTGTLYAADKEGSRSQYRPEHIRIMQPSSTRQQQQHSSRPKPSSSAVAQRGAVAMIRELAAFPATGVLVLHACGLQLHAIACQLATACEQVSSADDDANQVWLAMERAAQGFEASQLLLELQVTVQLR